MMARIEGLDHATCRAIRSAVRDAMHAWPLFHETAEPLADLHAAFGFLRSRAQRLGLPGAITALRRDAASFEGDKR